MSYEEKSTWAYLFTAIVVPIIYGVTVFSQITTTPVEDIDYAGPLLTAIGAAIALGILSGILIGIGAPREAGKADERDRVISRRGELVGYIVLSISIVGALLLVLAEVQYFWIANAIYFAFLVAAIVSSVVKLVAYRRGF